MAKGNRKWWYIIGCLVFIVYIFSASRPIAEETVLKPRWITSLGISTESNLPLPIENFSSSREEEGKLLAFRLGDRFGYVQDDGKFSINQISSGYVSLSENFWAEYEALPSSIRIMNPRNELILEISDPQGYPFFLDDRIFIMGREQNSLTALGQGGEELWTHDFPSPITCIDAGGGFVLAGTLDGAVMLLDSSGALVFTPFEPGGSRLSVILGCAISRDASRLAIISGIDNQRFLLMEQFGDAYRVVHHEFLSGGFRRPVHIGFVDGGTKIAYEREEGLGIYDILYRTSTSLSLSGEIEILDNYGGDGFLFLVTSQGPKSKRFVAVRYPGTIVIDAPFRSDRAFLARRERFLFLGGDSALASLELEKK